MAIRCVGDNIYPIRVTSIKYESEGFINIPGMEESIVVRLSRVASHAHVFPRYMRDRSNEFRVLNLAADHIRTHAIKKIHAGCACDSNPLLMPNSKTENWALLNPHDL